MLKRMAFLLLMVVPLWHSACSRPSDGTPVVLTGVVSSEVEGPMGGVLVKVKGVGRFDAEYVIESLSASVALATVSSGVWSSSVAPLAGDCALGAVGQLFVWVILTVTEYVVDQSDVAASPEVVETRQRQ